MTRPSLSEIWQSIIFDPLSYIHPQRINLAAELIERPAARAAANELILAAWQLDKGNIGFTQNSLTQLWLRQWHRLPQVAYLLGCHERRADLARQGLLLKLPDWARAFLVVNQGTSQSTGTQALDHSMLLSIGYAQLKAWCSCLPEPLIQRFPLLFPAFIEGAPEQPAVESSILILALQHAQRYPNIFPT